MEVTALRVRSLRSHRSAEVALSGPLTIVDGPNGAGKTNLLEALVLALTGRSWRTRSDRELLRHGEQAGRAEADFTDAAGGSHTVSLTVDRGAADRRHLLDGNKVDEHSARPKVVVFAPDRLALIQGAPQGRRAHLDQVVTALWPARLLARRSYSAALAQRNALLHRPGAAGIEAWEHELARHGVELRRSRQEAVGALAPIFEGLAQRLGLPGAPGLQYRASDDAADAEALAALFAERRARDRERGFTTTGPHRDDLLLRRDSRDLRTYGSQGEQRLGVLALLLAERKLITERRGSPPLALLNDVGSELDPQRRALLVEEVCGYGQVVIATTSAAELGGGDRIGPARVVHVAPGAREVGPAAGDGPAPSIIEVEEQ